MEKLSHFFSKRKAAGESKPIDESSFPEFSPEEEKEIFETLGVSPTVALHNNTNTDSSTSSAAAAGNGTGASTRPPRVKDVVFGTLRSLKQVKVAEAPVETEAVATAASSDVEDLGTVRIKLADGRSKWGTLRRHKTNPAEIVLQDLGLEDSSSDSSSDSNSDANTGEADSGSGSSSATQLSGEADDDEMYSSVRIKDPSVLESLEQEYGTMRINSGGSTSPRSDEKPLWMSGGGSEEPQGFQKFQWRQPEDWELAIIALERGEFDPTNMKDDAFRKYKKERPKLANLASQFFVVEPAPISAPSTPTGKGKRRRKKTKSVDKSSGKDSLKVKDKKPKSGSSGSSRRKSVGTNNSSSNISATTPASPPAAVSSPTQSGGEEKKERKWAAFKRGASASKESN